MEHVAHIRLVYPHAEGVGGDYYRRTVRLEAFLVFAPLLLRQPGVVARRRVPSLEELSPDLVHSPPGQAVDYAALPPAAAEELHQRSLFALRSPHLEVQVFPVETGGDHTGLPQAQKPDNVVSDLRRGGGGESSQHGAAGERPDEVAYLQIARAEVLTPLGDAVSLVHGDERYRRATGEVHEILRVQPLRGHVEQRILPRGCVFKHCPHLPVGQRAVQIGRRHAGLAKGAHLVLHKGDQRRDNQGDALEDQGGDLKTERLSRAGGHYPHRVAPFKKGVDYLLLTGPEGVEAEILLQRRLLAARQHPAAPEGKATRDSPPLSLNASPPQAAQDRSLSS